jgi:hypothetical protein
MWGKEGVVGGMEGGTHLAVSQIQCGEARVLVHAIHNERSALVADLIAGQVYRRKRLVDVE